MVTDLELMARIASLYYLEDQSQAEIADRFGISRIKVGRLLKQAREVGIVEVRINTPSSVSADLESELSSRFKLKQTLLVAVHESEDAQHQHLGRLVSEYLSPQLRDGAIVAVGMGRNVAAVAASGPKSAPISCSFVSAIGGSPEVGDGRNSGDICRRFAQAYGGRSEILYAPAYAPNSDVRDSFLQHEDVSRTLCLAAQAQIAIVGIGDASQDSAVVQMGCFAPPDMQRMRRANAVGDILGFFFNVDGRGLEPGMSDRVISLDRTQLQEIPTVIGIAAEQEKVQSILGALRTGVIDVLATSTTCARSILDMDSRS